MNNTDRHTDMPDNKPKIIRVCIEGKRALFTRPELVAERQSYPVPTKSALKGILRAVYKHDGMNYRILSIHVCNQIQTDVVWRNELTETQIYGENYTPKNYIDRNRRNCSSPRGTAFLKNVRYIVEAEIIQLPHYWPDSKEHTLAEHYDIFYRHLRRGATQHAPWIGCREFEANVEEYPQNKEIQTYYKNRKIDLGLILEDLHYTLDGREYPVIAEAKIENGTIIYGKRYYPEDYPREEVLDA